MAHMSYLTLFALGLTFALAHGLVFIPEHQLQHLVRPLPDAGMSKCDYKCTRIFEPICATNGQCVDHFPSACAMAAYNCEYPHRPFVIVDDWKCEHNWAPLCANAY